MDIAVNLVESYLRLTGYLTLSEFEVQQKDERGRYKAVTDIDIMALRHPGEVYIGDPHDHPECKLLLIDDPALQLEPDCIDVIIGEVKQGHAELNPGIKIHGVLHSMLRRLDWIYDDDLVNVVEGLQAGNVHYATAKGGDRVRTRLMAFGRSEKTDLHTMSISHIVNTMLRFFDEHEDAFRPIQFRDPAPGFLRLLLKAGFTIDKNVDK